MSHSWNIDSHSEKNIIQKTQPLFQEAKTLNQETYIVFHEKEEKNIF